MQLAEIARLFVYNGLWRVTGWRAPGRALVRALGANDESLRAIAGMFLIKRGRQSEPLLDEALHRGEHLPAILTILGDIGDKAAEVELRQFAQHEDPKVAAAARDALRVLNAAK